MSPRRDIPTRLTWTVSCPVSGKRSYVTRSQAKKIARQMNDKCTAYLCEHCGSYHVGHSSVGYKVAVRTRPQEMPEGFYASLEQGLAKARQEEADRD